jgi:Trypsin-like peptidase domain
MNMRSPFLIKTSLCVIILLFVNVRVANAQDVAPENVSPEEEMLELTPDEEIPWEDTTKKKMPEGVAPNGVAPEKKIVDEEYVVPDEHTMAMMIVVGTSGDSQTNIPGFACKFKNREYIATNLRVIEDASAITVASLSGNSIEISDQMIVTEDADICLLGIKGSFADLGIVPFEFMDDVPKGSNLGDEVICLGIDFNDVVITTTKGKIKTLGQSSVQTDATTVNGNSGGPMIHRESGKVIGLVAQAVVDDAKSDPPANAEAVSSDSQAGEITCSGHRVDAVKKWKSMTFTEFKKSSSLIASARGNLDTVYHFLTDKPGWRNDKSLATTWDNYEKFLEDKSTKNTKETDGKATKEKDSKTTKEKDSKTTKEKDSKTTKEADGKNTKETDSKNTKETDGKNTEKIEVLEEVDEFSAFKAKISRAKGNGVSQGDYDKARLSVIKALDWKIQATQDVIKKSTPIGLKQIQAINGLKSDSQKLADAIRKL